MARDGDLRRTSGAAGARDYTTPPATTETNRPRTPVAEASAIRLASVERRVESSPPRADYRPRGVAQIHVHDPSGEITARAPQQQSRSRTRAPSTRAARSFGRRRHRGLAAPSTARRAFVFVSSGAAAGRADGSRFFPPRVYPARRPPLSLGLRGTAAEPFVASNSSARARTGTAEDRACKIV